MSEKTIGEVVHRAIYGKSNDPLHFDNKENDDFLRGYDVGLKMKSVESSMDQIEKEWRRIGSPEYAPQSYLDFKRGLWAGRFKSTELNTLAQPKKGAGDE